MFASSVFQPGRAFFRGAAFGQAASFNRASFGDWADFYGVIFEQGACFIGAAFGEHANLTRVTFGMLADFTGAAFGNVASFSGAAFCPETKFNQAHFKYVAFSGEFYIIKSQYRGRGFGLQLWNAAMAYMGGRNVGLDGVIAQQGNYRKSGFKLAYRSIRHQGEGGGAEPSSR